MDPLVYPIYIEKPISISEDAIQSCSHPPLPLLKYGHTHSARLDLTLLTASEKYTDSLDVHLSSDVKKQIGQALGLKPVNTASTEIWECLALLDLWKDVSKVYAPGCQSVMEGIAKARGKKWKVTDVDGKGDCDLALFRYTNDPLDEGICLKAEANILGRLLSSLQKGGSAILQIPSFQTLATAQILTWMQSQFDRGYLLRPSITPNLYGGCYCLGVGYRGEATLPAWEGCLHDLGIPVHPDVDRAVTCMAGKIYPAQHHQYHRTRAYLDGRVYDGTLRDLYSNEQQSAVEKWIERVTGNSEVDQYVAEYQRHCPAIPENILAVTDVYTSK